jgi:oxalate---CoA ligase
MAEPIFFLQTLGSIEELATGVAYSSARLIEQVWTRMEELAGLGVSSGDRVILSHTNSAGFFVDLFAVWALGACAVPLDASLPPAELRALSAHAGAKIHLRGETGSGGCGRTRAVVEARPDNDALILYTSGTMSKPKGVVHTLGGVLNRLSALVPHVPLGALDRSLCVLSTAFGHGLIGNSLYPLLNGRTLLLLPPFSHDVAGRLGELIDDHRVSFLSSVPALWQLALNYARPPANRTLKLIHCASAPLSVELWLKIRSWASGAEVRNVYGTTETASWIAGCDNSAAPIPGLVGKAWGAEFKILDDQGRPTLGEGEIWVRTESLMRTYLQQESLYHQSVDQGWYKTGDYGSLDPHGQLRLLGRRDDLINKAGRKISPEEVEEALLRRVELVDACVFSLPHPIAGEMVAAAVTFDPASSRPDVRQLEAWCLPLLAPEKIPTSWFELTEINRNSRGKLKRSEIRNICLKMDPLK